MPHYFLSNGQIYRFCTWILTTSATTMMTMASPCLWKTGKRNIVLFYVFLYKQICVNKFYKKGKKPDNIEANMHYCYCIVHMHYTGNTV